MDKTMEAHAGVPDLRVPVASDLRSALAAGWHDMRRAPAFGAFFAGVYVLGGWMLWWAMTTKGQVWWTIPITLGFPLLGPFIAVGFYEVSRRLEAAAPLSWPAVLGVILRQKDRQLPSIAAVVVVFFLFWNFLAHMIFALFMGLQVMTNISSSYEAFLTPNGLAMIAVGTAVGAVFAALLFSMTVIALPMLLDREVDFVTAMLTSIEVVKSAPVLMLGWGAFIAVVLFLAMLPAFLGLFIALPLLGHATWHLYRRVVQAD
jgi:uncharacterized membrane protein